MSIVRAKKATPEVFFLCVCCFFFLYILTLCVLFGVWQIRKAHYDGFIAFLDRLVREGSHSGPGEWLQNRAFVMDVMPVTVMDVAFL